MNRSVLISTFGTSAIAVGLSLVTSVILARSLGPDGRGTLLALTFWPAMLASLLGLSVNEATAYHVARADAVDGAEGVKRFTASALVVQIAIAAVATLLALALMPYVLPYARHADLPLVMLYAVAFIPFSTLDMHFKSVLQGRGAFKKVNLVRLVQPVTYVLGILVLLFAMRLTVETIMGAIVAALCLSVIAGVATAGLSLQGATTEAASQSLATGGQFHLANVLLYAAAETDKLIVLQLMDDTRIGFYAVGIAISALGTGIVVQSLGLAVMREMASAASSTDRANVLVRNMMAASLVLVLANGLAAATAPVWLPMIFGSNFAGAIPVTMILLLMGTIKGMRSVMDRAMRAVRNTAVGVTGEAVALASLLIFASLGGFLGGLEGLAWGIVGAQICSFAAMAVITIRALCVESAQLPLLLRNNAARLGQIARREVQLVRAWWRR